MDGFIPLLNCKRRPDDLALVFLGEPEPFALHFSIKENRTRLCAAAEYAKQGLRPPNICDYCAAKDKPYGTSYAAVGAPHSCFQDLEKRRIGMSYDDYLAMIRRGGCGHTDLVASLLELPLNMAIQNLPLTRGREMLVSGLGGPEAKITWRLGALVESLKQLPEAFELTPVVRRLKGMNALPVIPPPAPPPDVLPMRQGEAQ